MSWLNDLKYNFRFRCESDHVTHIESKEGSDDMRKMTVFCEECGKPTQYNGFEPIKVGQTHHVEYEQNGRKAVRTRDKDGNVSHISKTRLHYKKTGRIENQYTPAYQAHLEKTNQEQLLRTEHSRRKGSAKSASARQTLDEQIGSLPDGEYVSDGSDFIAPAPKDLKAK